MTTPNSNDTLAARLGYALHKKKDLFTEEQLAQLAKTAAGHPAPAESFTFGLNTQMSGLEENLKKFIRSGEGYEPDPMTESDNE